MVSPDERKLAESMNNNQSATPERLTFELSSPRSQDYKCIKLGNEVIHRIGNVEKFYEALGYTDEIRQTQKLMPDEFLWAEYTKDNAPQSPACLQAKILDFLMVHSVEFKQKYGGQYPRWIEQLRQNCMRQVA